VEGAGRVALGRMPGGIERTQVLKCLPPTPRSTTTDTTIIMARTIMIPHPRGTATIRRPPATPRIQDMMPAATAASTVATVASTVVVTAVSTVGASAAAIEV
jgi:hypothetical protein